MSLCRRGHPRLNVFPFVGVDNNCVEIKRQLRLLLPHEGVSGQIRLDS